jgi:hypothetical protein
VIVFEAHARLLQIIHAVIGAALVAASTHLAIWTWKLGRGQGPRLGGVRWMAAATCLLYVLAFGVGNLLYPTYKIRVRLEYLDAPAAQRDEAALRQAAHQRVARRLDASRAPDPSLAAAREGDLAGVAHVFDIKEHLAALGLFLALGALVLAFTLPRPWPQEAARRGEMPLLRHISLLLVCAVGVAIVTWLAALIGLYVSSFRSLGGVG